MLRSKATASGTFPSRRRGFCAWHSQRSFFVSPDGRDGGNGKEIANKGKQEGETEKERPKIGGSVNANKLAVIGRPDRAAVSLAKPRVEESESVACHKLAQIFTQLA